jgi:hypothetical protein
MNNPTYAGSTAQPMNARFWPIDPSLEDPATVSGDTVTKSLSPDAIATEVRRRHSVICERIDLSFACLMLVQWAAAIFGVMAWLL